MKYLLIQLILWTGVLFSSCTDYLNIVPKGEKIPTTLADFEALLRDEYTIGQTPVANALYLLNDRYLTVSNLNTPILATANYMWDEQADRIILNNSSENTYYYLTWLSPTATLSSNMLPRLPSVQTKNVQK